MTQPTPDPAVEVTASPARTLRDAARYLARHGWTQGAYYDATGGSFTPPACMVGAVGMVCFGGPVDAPALNFDDPGWTDFEQALTWLDRFIAGRYPARQHHDGYGCAYEYNDARGRTGEQVIAVLDAAAERWDADQASRPGPVEEPEAGHVDYPHQPGTLYDCPACETACHCEDGFCCVHCAADADDPWLMSGGAR